MPNKPLAGRPLTLLVCSIACSLASFAILVIHPQGTDSWRVSLNVVAVLLVITATVLGRGTRGGEA